jgi:hypothetical protein
VFLGQQGCPLLERQVLAAELAVQVGSEWSTQRVEVVDPLVREGADAGADLDLNLGLQIREVASRLRVLMGQELISAELAGASTGQARGS